MKCTVCGDEVPEIRAYDKHIVIGKSFKDAHIHVHGDIDDKSIAKELLDTAYGEVGVSQAGGTLDRKEVVFHNRQRIGDMLMFTCAVRDFKAAFPDVRVGVISTGMHIWDHNPHIDRKLAATPDNTIMIGPSKLTNASNRIDWHFANAYRISIEDALKIHIPQGESRPDIWFTQEEYNAPRITPKPYWIIVIGGEKGWGCKMYPFEKWQEFIDQNPYTLFYQLGSAGDQHPRLKGDNVIDYIGKTEDRNTGIRDLFKLFLNAEGSIGLVSFHMHLSGALHKPAIVVAGAREPVSFTRYPGHQYLATDGCLPCGINACWHCNIDTCTNLVTASGEKVPRCVDMITPGDLTHALYNYYAGGRLQRDVASLKPKLKNIVKTPIITQAVKAEEKPSIDVKTKYGLEWGGGCITSKDWEFMKQAVEKYQVKTVLEFGTGLSTLLMNDAGLKVTTYESVQAWIDKIKTIRPECFIKLLPTDLTDSNPEFILVEKYDLAFVDGPAGGANREETTKLGAESARIVIIHDAGRPFELQWQEKYLKGSFEGPIKGGNRCHLWIKVESSPGGVCSIENQRSAPEACIATPKSTLSPAEGKNGKFVKIVSTARGWGGCARSVTTIMKFLLKAGHRVEFIPFRNKVSSREYQEFFKQYPEILVTESYDTVRESCDVLFMYADDYIWEFGQPEIADVFSALSAERKIMMLNYRRGEVGKVPWTKGWDKYMFLNSTQERELLKLLPGVNTKVLPPCTELEDFLSVSPDYNNGLRIVRHSSQGDTKFAKDVNCEIAAALIGRKDLTISMLPGPSFVESTERFKKIPRTANTKELAAFLASGNLFWYSLPEGYMDMGPRVILEAMAVGLPILADFWGGVMDRLGSAWSTHPENGIDCFEYDCGWLCSEKQDMVKIINNVTEKELADKGKAAKERAREEFVPERWISEIVD